MVDRNQRPIKGGGEGLAGHEADHEARDQAWPGRRGDAVDGRPGQRGFGHGPGDQRIEDFDVGPRGDLGHDPTVGLVIGQLQMDDVGADPPIGVDDGRRRFITTCLEAEDDHDRDDAPGVARASTSL